MTSLNVQVWGDTDTGRQRTENQDTIFFASEQEGTVDLVDIAQHGHLLAVADGVGSVGGGQEASRAIIKHLTKDYYHSTDTDPKVALQNAILHANIEAARSQVAGSGATTLVAGVIIENKLYLANVGDSRAYLIRNNSIRQLTEDHSHEGRLYRYLVKVEEAQPDTFEPIEIEKDDRIILCSDGLYRTMSSPEELMMFAQHGSAHEATERLIDIANERGGPDNISVIVADITDEVLDKPKNWSSYIALFGSMTVLTIMLVSWLGFGNNGLFRQQSASAAEPAARAVIIDTTESELSITQFTDMMVVEHVDPIPLIAVYEAEESSR